MAWANYDARTEATDRVRNLIGTLRTIHALALILRDGKDLYQSGADSVFNTIFNELINTPADRTELSAMINQLTALCITDWEAAHGDALGLP